jgi:hypothetical protein
MATKPSLPRLDPPPKDYKFDSNEFQRWFSDVVDQINEAFQNIEDSLP